MQTTVQILVTVAVIAFATLSTRALPFILFPNNRSTPKFIVYLGKYLPFAVISMLIVYCMKSTSLIKYPYALPELIACIAVVLIHKWKHNLLLSIGGGTALYMLLVQVVFK